MKLSQQAQDKARIYIFNHGRPLEQARYNFHFVHGAMAQEAVFNELAAFQNPDGGFGHGLEPDVQTAASSVLATTVALQIMREVNTPSNHPLLQSALRYLHDSYDSTRQSWPIVPAVAADAPHAPWWQSEGLAERFGHFRNNPRAEIVGYLLQYEGADAGTLAATLLPQLLAHFDAQPLEMAQHDLLCYLRLAKTAALPAASRARLMPRLRQVVQASVVTDPAKWGEYGLLPLAVCPAPDALFAELFTAVLPQQLDYEIGQQQADGGWHPVWSWLGTFDDDWPAAAAAWTGVLTLERLCIFRNYGRLA